MKSSPVRSLQSTVFVVLLIKCVFQVTLFRRIDLNKMSLVRETNSAKIRSLLGLHGIKHI